MIEWLVAWFLSLSIFMMLAISFAYFIPAIIGFVRGHQSRWAIFVLNLLFGWTFLGWAFALIWSLTGVQRVRA